MSKIQCLTCGGMTDTGDSLTGTCEYCGCAISLKRISAFSCMETADLLKTRKALEKSEDSEIENRDLALALCYLKTGNFTLAKKKLEQVMDDVLPNDRSVLLEAAKNRNWSSACNL